MHVPRHVDPVLLARYLSGETSESESALVRAWLAAVPARQMEFDAVQWAWYLAERAAPLADASDVWRSVSARMRKAHGQAHQPRTRYQIFDRERRVPRHASWSIPSKLSAAVAACVVLIGATLAVFHSEIVFGGRTAEAVSRETREYSTPPGQRATIELADGTTLVLAPGSQLRYVYPASGPGVRDAYLVGEALFSVTHDTTRPFVVHAKNTTTLDIGTTFEVRAFKESPLRVAVIEGRVALGADASHARPGNDTGEALKSVAGPASLPELVADGVTMLQAGDIASRARDGVTTVSRGEDMSALLGWTEGKIVFDGLPLREVVPVLERWYDLDITLAYSSLGDRPFTATFTTEPVNEVLNRIALALDLQVKRDGQTVVFSADKRSGDGPNSR